MVLSKCKFKHHRAWANGKSSLILTKYKSLRPAYLVIKVRHCVSHVGVSKEGNVLITHNLSKNLLKFG